ncbi:MAG: TrkA family potassium uptake protein [Chloroflexi bacterium]|nr:TrkA family potassium uptake protein [Chloroflexota bacterium]
MKKQVAVIGLGRFGASLAATLTNMGHDVLAVDSSEHDVQAIATQVTHAIQADATDETVLSELGIKNFDIAVVAIGSDMLSSILATVLLKRLNVPFVIARASNESHKEILRKIGADRVVSPENEMGERMAHEIRLGKVLDYMPVGAGYGITSIEAQAEFAGQALVELGLGPKGKNAIAVLLVKRGNEVIVSPSMGEVVRPGDTLIVAGSDDNLESFLSRVLKKSEK